jgi:hypothetical protein
MLVSLVQNEGAPSSFALLLGATIPSVSQVSAAEGAHRHYPT